MQNTDRDLQTLLATSAPVPLSTLWHVVSDSKPAPYDQATDYKSHGEGEWNSIFQLTSAIGQYYRIPDMFEHFSDVELKGFLEEAKAEWSQTHGPPKTS